MNHPDFSKNYFELFNLPTSFDLDTQALDIAYRNVQREIHPDRFAAGSDAEKRLSMQWAMRANEGYQTLKKPLARGRYLLTLHGVDTEEETNTAMPVDFLMQQMEWREAVIEARESRQEPVLARLSSQLHSEETTLFAVLTQQLDNKKLDEACVSVRKLRFLEKLGEEIQDAFALIEN